MSAEPLAFDRPRDLEATRPPEDRGIPRDGVRLLVSDPRGEEHHTFRDLPSLLRPNDLLVVNDSATLAARLPASSSLGPFLVHLSTQYARDLWLAEPRWSAGRPGPLPLAAGDRFEVAGIPARVVAPYPGIDRLLFLSFEGDLAERIAQVGRPIRYGYLDGDYPLERYQTIFGRRPGSAEMPGAGRPFTPRVLRALAERGVGLASVTLHTGVSSLELERPTIDYPPLYPEPFEVPAETARSVQQAREAGGRVIAVGTTVVRALESAWTGERLRPARGFTQVFVRRAATCVRSTPF